MTKQTSAKILKKRSESFFEYLGYMYTHTRKHTHTHHTRRTQPTTCRRSEKSESDPLTGFCKI